MRLLVVFSFWFLVLSCGSSERPLPAEKSLIKDTVTEVKSVEQKVVYPSKVLMLPEPSQQFSEVSANSICPEYDYFISYFKAISDTTVLKHFEGTKSPCSWKQEFENNIVFEYEDCQEVGRNVKIIFPNYPKAEIVKFVEWFYETEENQWNKDQTSYSPKEEGAGCYFEILQDSSANYVLDYYCGC